jgi:hypothetical protein
MSKDGPKINFYGPNSDQNLEFFDILDVFDGIFVGRLLSIFGPKKTKFLTIFPNATHRPVWVGNLCYILLINKILENGRSLNNLKIYLQK